MSRLIRRAIDRALGAVAAEVFPLVSAKLGPLRIAELTKSNAKPDDAMSRRINHAPDPAAKEMVDPIAIVDIGCGSQLKMLSIGDDHVVDIYRESGSFEPASLMVWSHLAKQSSYAITLLIDDVNMSLIDDVQKYHPETTRNVIFYPSSKQALIEQVDHNSSIAIRP